MNQFTARDRKILSMYVAGKSVSEIAPAVGLAEPTLRSEFHFLRDKLGVPSGMQLGQYLVSRIPKDVLRQYI